MLKHKEKFSHIEMAEKKERKKKTHKMKDGTIHTGEKHTKDSKPLTITKADGSIIKLKKRQSKKY